MEEELKVLLAENSRLLALNLKASDSLTVIPVLIRHGSFTPTRLERWPFADLSREIQCNPEYRDKFLRAFLELVKAAEGPTFTLNEKKAVSILLAAKDHFEGQIQAIILGVLQASAPRSLLAYMEFVNFPLEYQSLSQQCSQLPMPFPCISSLAPKLNAKYPLLLEMINRPSIDPPKRAIDLLLANQGNETENRVVLECAARYLDSYQLYTDILTPIWGNKRESVVALVLDALSRCKELESFCKKCLAELEDTTEQQ